MMTYEEFLEKAKADADRCDPNGHVPMQVRVDHPDSFVAAWVVSGHQADHDGGYALSEEPEPAPEPLLELLDDLGLKRRQVNEIMAMFKRDETVRQSLDYYGSWNRVAYKTLSFDDLHEKLVGYGVVEPRPGMAP